MGRRENYNRCWPHCTKDKKSGGQRIRDNHGKFHHMQQLTIPWPSEDVIDEFVILDQPENIYGKDPCLDATVRAALLCRDGGHGTMYVNGHSTWVDSGGFTGDDNHILVFVRRAQSCTTVQPLLCAFRFHAYNPAYNECVRGRVFYVLRSKPEARTCNRCLWVRAKWVTKVGCKQWTYLAKWLEVNPRFDSYLILGAAFVFQKDCWRL